MQNFIKSQTRLAFIQFIFQLEVINQDKIINVEEFQKYFYNSNIAAIGEKKEFILKFNKIFFKKLSANYTSNFDKNNVVNKINTYIKINRKFEKWDSVLKSLIYAIISELQITDKKKIKIMLNDYINISKSLVSPKETKLMNAIIQKYIDEKKI